MKAIILAAGKGNRLKPYTDDIPKTLLAIKKDAAVEHVLLTAILTTLPSYIDEVFIVVKYLEEKVRDFIRQHEAYIEQINPRIKKITCVTQTEAKGTMGAVQSIRNEIQPDERFLVLNGDDLHTQEELEKFNLNMYSFGVQKKIMPGYNSIQINEKGIVTGLAKQTADELSGGCLIATGTYMLDGKFFDFEPVVLSDGEIGLPQTLLKHVEVYPSYAVHEHGWVSINTVEDLMGLWG